MTGVGKGGWGGSGGEGGGGEGGRKGEDLQLVKVQADSAHLPRIKVFNWILIV